MIVFISSFLAGLAAVFGAYSAKFLGESFRRNSVFVISFAVGVLLATAFLHLLPEAVELNQSWPYFLLATIIVFYVIEHAVIIHTCQEYGCEAHAHAAGKIGFWGIGFHSLIDGLTIGISFQVEVGLGLLVSAAVFLHKLAEGTCLFSLLTDGEASTKKAVNLCWLVSLMTPLGAVVTSYFVKNLPAEILGIFLAAAAGGLIYISASDLVPTTHKKSSWINVILVISGALFAYLLSYLE